jgi:hypothetical protein
MRLTLTLLGLTGLMLATGCKKGLDDKEKIVDVDKEFKIEMWDRLTENGDNLQLNIETFKNQDCEGVRIKHFASNLNNRVVVTLNSLEMPQNCSGIKEPARDTIQVPQIDKAGRYEFQLNLKDAVFNRGYLTVEESKYSIELTQENGISIPVKEILRVPKDAVWGFVGFDNGHSKSADSFVDSLKTIATEVNFVSGEYGYFNIQNGSISLPTALKSQKTNSRAFILRLNNKARLYETVSAFRSNNNIDFKILTSEGKIYSK